MKKFILLILLANALTVFASNSSKCILSQSNSVALSQSDNSTLSGSFPVKKNGSVIGSVSYSARFTKNSYNDNYSVHIDLENKTNEYVRVAINNLSSGVSDNTTTLSPYSSRSYDTYTSSIPSQLSAYTSID